MCEFKVLKLNSNNLSTDKVAEDIIYMKYNPQTGESSFSDILGRKFDSKNAFITEINMFENKHEITIIENNLVPLFAKLVYSMNSDINSARNVALE